MTFPASDREILLPAGITEFPLPDMILDTTSFSDPQANLDYDDELLRRAELGGGEVLRFWESPVYFVVLGRTGLEADDVEQEAVLRDKIPVLRRSSGGGTVLQGPGCLNFSVILSRQTHPSLESISGSYRFILDKIVTALGTLGVDAVFRPVCDLALKATDQKFSGNAQRRGRGYILHHGTILYDFDLSLVSKYLTMPKKMPDYRNARPHARFVTNISVDTEELCSAISEQFSNTKRCTVD